MSLSKTTLFVYSKYIWASQSPLYLNVFHQSLAINTLVGDAIFLRMDFVNRQKTTDFYHVKKINRKVQGAQQSQTAANPRHQEEEKNDKNYHVQNKQTNAREAHRPATSSPSEVITMLKGMTNTRTKSTGRL